MYPKSPKHCPLLQICLEKLASNPFGQDVSILRFKSQGILMTVVASVEE